MRLGKFTCLLTALITVSAVCMTAKAAAAHENKTLRILFTHDMHDHLLPNKAEKDGWLVSSGGYARLKTAIDQERKNYPGSVLVDGGDYSMGSLFQTLFSGAAPELRIMGRMGYDVTTFGNHEFDFRDTGLARHLYAAKISGEKLPEIVASNLYFPDREKMTGELWELKNSMTAFGIKEYTVLERSGLRIGVFGLMGKDAADSAPMTGVEFRDIVKSAKLTAGKLKDREKVDIIICLSHSGTSKVRSESEDLVLAEKVPEIDVIISGHTHTKLESPLIAGKTLIGSCGEYGNYLGIIDLRQGADRRWELEKYSLRPVSEDIELDAGISEAIENYKSAVQKEYLDKFALKFDEVLAGAPFSFIATEKIGAEFKEEPLGSLIADGYMYSVKKAEGVDYEPVDVSVVAAGTMRGSFVRGEISVGDAFIASSLGTGPDGVAGYPLISVYLTGRELMELCEVDASVSPLMSSAQLYMSGLVYTVNPNRMIFNRVTEAHLTRPDGTSEKLQEKKLYRLVTGLYNAQMLSIVGEKSFGLLSIVPKDRKGNPISDFEEHIIYDTSNSGKNEVKEWFAIAQYLKSFSTVNGISQVPVYYRQPHGRKVIDNDTGLGAILKNPGRVAVKIYMILLAAVIITGAAIYLLLRLRRYLRNKKRKFPIIL